MSNWFLVLYRRKFGSYFLLIEHYENERTAREAHIALNSLRLLLTYPLFAVLFYVLNIVFDETLCNALSILFELKY